MAALAKRIEELETENRALKKRLDEAEEQQRDFIQIEREILAGLALIERAILGRKK